VISVGNITLGGTGKTPLTIFIAQMLAEMGEKPAIVSRGYKRKDESRLVVASDGEKVIEDAGLTGDEPLEMALALRGRASVICDSNRVRGAAYAAERLNASVVVLDDAFQHRKIRRDLDIVVIDATAPFGGGITVPAGRLRENLHNLSRADAFVISRTEETEKTDHLVTRLRDLNPKAPVFLSSFRIGGLEPVSHTSDDDEAEKITSWFAVCGIGNPQSFLSLLEAFGIRIAGSRAFPDHYRYSEADLREVAAEARLAGAKALITTGKDAVKLRGLTSEMPIFKAIGGIELKNRSEFEELVAGAVSRKALGSDSGSDG